MSRTIRFQIRVTPVELFNWVPSADEVLSFPYEKAGIAGTISLGLDNKALEWEQIGDEYNDIAIASCRWIAIVVEGNYDSRTTTTAGFIATAHELAVEYVKMFIAFIRTELGQYWVDPGPISEWGISEFLGETGAKWINNGEMDVGIPLGGWPAEAKMISPRKWFRHRASNFGKTEWENLRNSLKEKYSPSSSNELISNAMRHLENGELGLASVAAVTALEARLEGFVKRRCNEKGISNKTFKNVGRGLFVAGQLKLLLPLVLRENELDDRLEKIMNNDLRLPYTFSGEQVVEWCRDLINARNRFVHYGEKPGFETIKRGIDTTDLLLRFIQVT